MHKEENYTFRMFLIQKLRNFQKKIKKESFGHFCTLFRTYFKKKNKKHAIVRFKNTPWFNRVDDDGSNDTLNVLIA